MSRITELKLQKASFKGVDFLWESVETTGGRKVDSTEYPNADYRDVEDLGLLDDKFTVNAVITGQRSLLDIIRYSDYYTWRDAFENALRSKGAGILIHPTRGQFFVQVSEFRTVEILTEIGRANISVQFEKTRKYALPASSKANSGIINGLSNTGIGNVVNNIRNTVDIIRMTKANIDDFIGKVRGIGAIFGAIRDKFSSGTGTIDDFSNSINLFKNNTAPIATNPDELAIRTADIVNQSNEYGDNGLERFNIATNLYNFGDDDLTPTIDTYENRQKIDNRNIINQSINTCALIQSYRNIPLIDLSDQEIINYYSSIIDAQYSKFVSYDKIDLETIATVNAIRYQVGRFIADSLAVAYKIESVYTNRLPMRVFDYSYYGDNENLDRLIELNGDKNILVTEGNVKILTP
jgi:hypothetical protein